MDTFSALADPTRRHILEMLASKVQLSASDISRKFHISPPAISQHLKVLKEAKLVTVEKRAQQRIYQINPQAMTELETWIKQMTQRWNKRFDALDEVIRNEKKKQKRKDAFMQKRNKKELVLERTVNASVEEVWKALTDITLLKKWLSFFPDFKPEIGFETRFLLGPDDHKYLHICKVLDVVPYKKLSYSWYYDGYPGKSHVVFTLIDLGKKTKVQLTHTVTEEFPKDNHDFDEKNFREGWTYTIDALKNFMENRIS